MIVISFLYLCYYNLKMLKILNVTKIYDNDIIALNNVSLDFTNYGLNIITGNSGSGKSTLINAIALLESISDGKIIWNNQVLNNISVNSMDMYRANLYSFIFQEFNLVEEMTVMENLQLVDVSDDIKIAEIIAKIGLSGCENIQVSNLSGGERQRVSIARALVKNTKIIIADEPTGNLDDKNGIIVMDLLKKISQDHLVIVVTHNQEYAKKYADRLIKLSNGNVIEDRIINKTELISNSDVLNYNIKKYNLSHSFESKIYKKEFKSNFKRIRGFLITILISILMLTFSLTLIFNSSGNIIQNNLNSFGFKLFEIEKFNDDKFYTSRINFTEDYNYLRDNDIKAYPYIKNNITMDYNDFYNFDDLKIIFTDDYISTFTLLCGDYPTNNFEIIISDYVAEVLLKTNYFTNVKNMSDLIDLYYDFNYYELNFKIVGIYDTIYEDYGNEDWLNIESRLFDSRGNFISSFVANQSTFLLLSKNITHAQTAINIGGLVSSSVVNITEDNLSRIIIKDNTQDEGVFITTSYLVSKGYSGDYILNNSQDVFNDIGNIINIDVLGNRKRQNIIGIYDNLTDVDNPSIRQALVAVNQSDIWDYSQDFGLLINTTTKNILNKCWELKYNVTVDDINLFKSIDKSYKTIQSVIMIIGFIVLIIYVFLFYSYCLFTIEEKQYNIGVFRSIGISKKSINRLFIKSNLLISSIFLICSLIIVFPLFLLTSSIKLPKSKLIMILYDFNIIYFVMIVIIVVIINIIITLFSINHLNKKSICNIVRNI